LADVAAGDVREPAGGVAEEIGENLEVGELVIRRERWMGLRRALDLFDG
jgi:hypothetical protein